MNAQMFLFLGVGGCPWFDIFIGITFHPYHWHSPSHPLSERDHDTQDETHTRDRRHPYEQSFGHQGIKIVSTDISLRRLKIGSLFF
jgi:hypothetical protein